MRFGTRLLIASALPLLIGVVTLFLGSQYFLERQFVSRVQQVNEQGEEAIKLLLQSYIRVAIKQAQQMLEEGASDQEVLQRISTLRDGDLYIWAHTFDPKQPTRAVIVMHPTNSELVGRDLSNVKDLDSYKKIWRRGRIYDKGAPEVSDLKNTQLMQVMNRSVAQQGGGFVRYYWNKPDGKGGATEEAYPKIAYVELVPERGWVFGTGVYSDHVESLVTSKEAEARSQGREAQIALAALLALVVLLNMGVVFWFLRRLTGPVDAGVRTLHNVSADVTVTATQVADVSRTLAESTAEQAANLEEVSSTLTELSSQTQQNSNGARSARELAEETERKTVEGASVMEEMVAVIGQIKDSADKMAEINKTIDGLAFQTNLLALNASVEAARAGDAGRGFAVVAEEVRALAQRSAVASRDTSSLIDTSQSRAQEGVRVAERVVAVLSDVRNSVTDMGRIVAEVAASSEEQALAVEQVSQALEQIDRVTQRIAENSEETSSASQELGTHMHLVEQISEDLARIMGSNHRNGNRDGSSDEQEDASWQRHVTAEETPQALPHHEASR